MRRHVRGSGVGSGIVGAATSWELTSKGDEPAVVLEKEQVVAGHQTTHNSGVIQAGIYYNRAA
ncbi:FAD-dependent oxidoreductase [Kribbella sp. NBC_01510]|uniref:FAD-dependent oxidoreductase n=1 Tax=Kribbella sp. NBC_01510 TaxID=2903581 RepID=UPI003866BB51